MKEIIHSVKTTVNGEGREDEVISQVFETLEELIDTLGAGGDDANGLMALLNSAIITRDKNSKRAAMRPADPKAAFNRTRNEIVEQLLKKQISEEDALAAIHAAAALRDEALNG